MIDDHDDDAGGDLPDTFDDRLTAIGLLVDSLGAERDPARTTHRRQVIVALLAELGADVLARITTLLDRLGE